jgi:hypothetical protein
MVRRVTIVSNLVNRSVVERLRILGNLLGQELQGCVPTKHEVFSLVHHTHPAAELAQHSDGLADHEVDLERLAKRPHKFPDMLVQRDALRLVFLELVGIAGLLGAEIP